MSWALRHEVHLEARPTEGRVLLYPRGKTDGGPTDGKHRAPIFPLHPLQAVTLTLLDGKREPAEIVGLLSDLLDSPQDLMARLVDTTLDRYRLFLTDAAGTDPILMDTAPMEAGEPVGEGRATARNPAEYLFAAPPDSPHFGKLQEPAPAVLLWVVTEYCNKRCRYCYKDAVFTGRETTPDSTLRGERVSELAEEAAALGVTELVLSGGEPFLRPDLPELIAHFLTLGIEVIPITKARILGDRMARLAAARLRTLHVSLDSWRPETVDFLTGVDGAFEGMVDTLRAAAEHGVAVSLRPVMTRYNLQDLPGLAELGHSLGVRRFIVDTYGTGCGRHEEGLLLEDGDFPWLRQTVEALGERFEDSTFELRQDVPQSLDPGERGCKEGLQSLTFLPDGRVTKCEHWSGDEVIYGDLKTQSLLEVWQSKALQDILAPSRQRCEGTPCARCKKYERCNAWRGRCSLSALQSRGTLGAPDCYCPIGAFGKGSARCRIAESGIVRVARDAVSTESERRVS